MAVVAGLLLLAFVYFYVGQAAVLRNGAQTAADAAALSAAQDARDQLRQGWLGVIGEPAMWQQFVEGYGYVAEQSCERASELAALNDAKLSTPGCVPRDLGFTVTVESLGEAVVPGAEGRPAVATASAVIEPLCRFVPPEPDHEPSAETTTEPDPSSSSTAPPEEEDPDLVVDIMCDGEIWEIDPEVDPSLPGPDDLFRVRLTGDNE